APGLGIYLVLAIDTAYAMAAAVTIRSAIGRMTIYIVDCRLCVKDKEKIKSSLPEQHDVTLVFLDLPTGSLAAELGVALEELWNTDLEGSSIGAAMDVGFPMGHDGVSRRRYFNSGMLLIDLAKARTYLPELEARVHEMKDAPVQRRMVERLERDGVGRVAGIDTIPGDV
ncbi:hypothetical protein EDB19DRAFT_1630988, partial [Suillus lakei]